MKRKSISKRKQTKKHNTKKHNTKKRRIQKGGNLQITISYDNINNAIPNNTNITNQINELKSKQNNNPPSIQLQNAVPDTLYLITMTDPDAPPGVFTHWIATMQNNKILNTITDYMHPSPPEGSGTHKYITNVYEIGNEHIGNEQKEKIMNDLQTQIKNNSKLSRVQITTQLNNIISTNNLIPLSTHKFLVNP